MEHYTNQQTVKDWPSNTIPLPLLPPKWVMVPVSNG